MYTQATGVPATRQGGAWCGGRGQTTGTGWGWASWAGTSARGRRRGSADPWTPSWSGPRWSASGWRTRTPTSTTRTSPRCWVSRAPLSPAPGRRAVKRHSLTKRGKLNITYTFQTVTNVTHFYLSTLHSHRSAAIVTVDALGTVVLVSTATSAALLHKYNKRKPQDIEFRPNYIVVVRESGVIRLVCTVKWYDKTQAGAQHSVPCIVPSLLF